MLNATSSPTSGTYIYHVVLLAKTPTPDATTIISDGTQIIVNNQDGRESISLANLDPGTKYTVYVVNTLGNRATAVTSVDFATLSIGLTGVAVTQESYTTAMLAATSSPAIGSSIYHMVLLATTPAPDAGTIVAA